MGLLGLISVLFLGAEPQSIALPPGRTRLVDIGINRVGCVYADGRTARMADGWTGHFHGPSGISYTPFGRQDGKDCLLMHCPWRNGTGITWVEYPLQLPQTGPITLRLAIAMKTDVARPDRSDGCQFRVKLQPAEGGPQTLLDEHYAAAQWKPFQWDLTPHAGRRVVVRLEVGPGPANNASWDYAFFGDPEIVVGEAQKAPAAIAPLWPAAGDLKRLSNDRTLGCRPTGAQAAAPKFTWDESTGVGRYDIDWPADKGKISYSICTRREGPQAADRLMAIGATVTAPDGTVYGPYALGAGSGVLLASGAKTWEADAPGVKVRLLSAAVKDDRLTVTTEYSVEGLTAPITTEYAVKGSSLCARVQATPALDEVRFGSIAAPIRRPVPVPYLGLGPILYVPDSQLYASVVLDWHDSQATSHTDSTAHYLPKTDGKRNAVSTTAFYTLSPRVGEVVCNIPHAPSPFMNDLAGRIMFDIWGGRFRDDGDWFKELASYGVRNAAIIKHDWQRSGYDNALPNHYPANPKLGGDEDMIYYVEMTRGLGHRTSLHENYVDFYPNSELYDANDISLEVDGKPMKAWFNGGTGVQSFAAKPTSIMKYARMQSPEIHRRYGTNASYLDVHTCVPPWFHVDHRASEPGAASYQPVYKTHAELFAFERQTHEGPLFGEGNGQFYWAGLCDGCEAQVDGGENAAWLLDFDLLKVHPQMVNHGMGYLERWLSTGYGAGWYTNTPQTRAMDKYRAMELAFGHAGFVAGQIWHQLPYVLREYYLVTPIQDRYVNARPTAILYDVDGQMKPAAEALAAGPLSNRVYVEYDSGLKLWCNGSEKDWKIAGDTLPDYGFRAEANDLLSTTTLWPTTDGRKVVADYRHDAAILFADARSFDPDGFARIVRIEPSLLSVQKVGPRKFQITYRWKTHAKHDQKGLNSFVHFTSPDSSHPEEIQFQNDHPLPSDPLQWQVGQEVADGPHEVAVAATVPDGEYHVRIGLFNPNGRVSLAFESDGKGRYDIGTIRIKGDEITSTPTPLKPLVNDPNNLPYEGHINRSQAMVDFGKVVTNGCVAIRPMYKSWWVTVCPRERPFTIRLRMDRLDPKMPSTGWNVQMMNANSRSYGLVETQRGDGWIEWRTGQTTANYYCISR